MIFLQNITFLYPLYFIGIIPIVCLLLFLYFKKTKSINFSGFSDLQKIYGQNSLVYKWYFLLIFFISFVFLSILAHPVNYSSEDTIKKNGIDIKLVFDLSYSMIAEDLKPNRLEVAKDMISLFIDSLETDRVWLVLFSGKPFTSVPLTFDYDFLKGFIADISMETIDRRYWDLWWTAIGDALVLAYDSFDSDDEREKIIILITDGEANTWIDPITALKLLKENNIKTYTIWVWWSEDTFIEYVDDFGFKEKIAVWAVDEDTLIKIATETGWKYFNASSKEALKGIFWSIAELEKKEIEYTTIEKREDAYEPFLYMLILLFLLFIWVVYHKDINIW